MTPSTPAGDREKGIGFVTSTLAAPVTAAEAALRQCAERGVNVGGDPEAREKAPQEIADFLKPIFALAR